MLESEGSLDITSQQPSFWDEESEITEIYATCLRPHSKAGGKNTGPQNVSENTHQGLTQLHHLPVGAVNLNILDPSPCHWKDQTSLWLRHFFVHAIAEHEHEAQNRLRPRSSDSQSHPAINSQTWRWGSVKPGVRMHCGTVWISQ